MAGSPSPESSLSQGGIWVLPALAGLVLGPMVAAFGAWRHLSGVTAPLAPVLWALCLLLALTEFALASAFALQLGEPPSWWRPTIMLAVAALAIVSAVTAPHGLRWIGVLVAAALLGWNARLAETMGGHLGPLIPLGGEERHHDSTAMSPECTRIVLETWVITGAAVYASKSHGWIMVAAALVTALCGVVVIAGAKMGSLRLRSARDGFTWEDRDTWTMWRYVAMLGGGVAAISALITAELPPVASARFFRMLGSAFTSLFPNPNTFHPAPSTPVQPIHPSYASASANLSTNSGPYGHNAILEWLHKHLVLLLNGAFPEWIRHLILLWSVYLPRLMQLVLLVVLPLAVLVMVGRYVYETWGGGLNNAFSRLWVQISGIFSFRQLLAMWHIVPAERRVPPPPPRPTVPGPATRMRQAWQAFIDPRRAIRATYREFLGRAAESGHAIARGQTPAQFEESLAPVLSTERPAATELTRAYEEARYSDHELGVGLIPRLRQAMDQASNILHHLARPESERRWRLGRKR